MASSISPYLNIGKLRFVIPYLFEYRAFTKERWIGRKIIEVLSSEFEAFSLDYYQNAIDEGKITVNNMSISSDYLLSNGDLITHLLHRHEPPVLSSSIEVIHETDDIILVQKPSSIPVHPCGQYYHNSLLNILQYERSQKLFPIHRLDRLTSGILFIAKNHESASHYSKLLHSNTIKKIYLARVKGHFPYFMKVDHPIKCLNHKLSVHGVHPDGKPSCTLFYLLSYNGYSSLVECQPLTGRTHQIRIHLQSIGYPIVNDICYGGEPYHCSLFDDFNSNYSSLYQFYQNNLNYKNPTCPFCQKIPSLHHDFCYEIWLHAYQYYAEYSDYLSNFSFHTNLPIWAQEGFICRQFKKN